MSDKVIGSVMFTVPSSHETTSGVEAVGGLPPSIPAQIDPYLLQVLVQHGSPIVVLGLLIILFNAMTQFVKACRGG